MRRSLPNREVISGVCYKVLPLYGRRTEESTFSNLAAIWWYSIVVIMLVCHISNEGSIPSITAIDSWIDNRRFRCIVVRSIDIDMIVSYVNNTY